MDQFSSYWLRKCPRTWRIYISIYVGQEPYPLGGDVMSIGSNVHLEYFSRCCIYACSSTHIRYSQCVFDLYSASRTQKQIILVVQRITQLKTIISRKNRHDGKFVSKEISRNKLKNAAENAGTTSFDLFTTNTNKFF